MYTLCMWECFFFFFFFSWSTSSVWGHCISNEQIYVRVKKRRRRRRQSNDNKGDRTKSTKRQRKTERFRVVIQWKFGVIHYSNCRNSLRNPNIRSFCHTRNDFHSVHLQKDRAKKRGVSYVSFVCCSSLMKLRTATPPPISSM